MTCKTRKLKYRKKRTRKVGGTLPEPANEPVLKEYTQDEVTYIQSSLVECNLTIQEVLDSMKIIHTFTPFIQGKYLTDIFTKIKDKPSNQRHYLVYTFLDRISTIIEQLIQVLEDEKITANMALPTSIKNELKNVNSEEVYNQGVNTYNQGTTSVSNVVPSVFSQTNYGSVINKLSSLSQHLMSLINI